MRPAKPCASTCVPRTGHVEGDIASLPNRLRGRIAHIDYLGTFCLAELRSEALGPADADFVLAESDARSGRARRRTKSTSRCESIACACLPTAPSSTMAIALSAHRRLRARAARWRPVAHAGARRRSAGGTRRHRAAAARAVRFPDGAAGDALCAQRRGSRRRLRRARELRSVRAVAGVRRGRPGTR